MNVAALIDQAARTYPDAVAISWIDRPLWTYRELVARAGSLAAGLRRMGLMPGDRVTLAMSNHPAFYEVLLGAWFAGLTPAPQNCRLHPAEIGYAAGDCAARACFSTPDLTERLRDHLPRDCALIDVDSSAYARLHGHPRTRPGCSTPAARPASPRARSTPTARSRR
jgi:long-chain acyl-CoA synthetase